MPVALGPIRAIPVPSAQVSRAATYTWLMTLSLEIISHQHRYPDAHSPQHLSLLLQSGPSQPSYFPTPESSVSQTGHMDNHLKLITHLCHRDGPQTSGFYKPPLLPAPHPEMFYQMLQEKIQLSGQHQGWSMTQLCRLTPGTNWRRSDFSVVLFHDAGLNSPTPSLSITPREECPPEIRGLSQSFVVLYTFPVMPPRHPAPFIHWFI